MRSSHHNKSTNIDEMTTEHNSEKHNRQSIRLKDFDYSQAGAYFITICTHNRECILSDIVNDEMQLNEYGKIVKTSWIALPHRYPNMELDTFMIMPNHVHAIVVIPDVGVIHELPLPNDLTHRRRMLIPKIIGYAKMNTAKCINQLLDTPGARVWQRNYYEHIIRNDDELNQMREYISQNPLQWELDEENPRNR